MVYPSHSSSCKLHWTPACALTDHMVPQILAERVSSTNSQIKEQRTLNYCTVAAAGAWWGPFSLWSGTNIIWCRFPGAALLVYEYLITLGEESRLIWTNLRAGYAALFLANRAIMLCMSICMVLFASDWRSIVVRLPATSVSRHGTKIHRGMINPTADLTEAECP